MKARWYNLNQLNRSMRKHVYRNKALIKRVNYMDPKGHYSFEDKKVVWCEGHENEHPGWCTCTLQIVCPFVVNYRSDKKAEALGRCKRECHNEQMREAIEAFTTLNPNIT